MAAGYDDGPDTPDPPHASAAHTPVQRRGSSATRQQQQQHSQQSEPAAAAQNQQHASSISIPPLRKQPSNSRLPHSPVPSLSPAAASPRTSRNPSPARKDPRPTANIPSQPSAAAIQRALSASSVPQASTASASASASDATTRQSRPARTSGSASADTTPQWPISPRLKSPPPSSAPGRRVSANPTAARKVDAPAPPAPNISLQSASPTPDPTPNPLAPRQPSADVAKSDQQLLPPSKAASSRGPSGMSVLETVQENAADATDPSPAALQAAADLKPLTKLTDDDNPVKRSAPSDDPDKHGKLGESESESGGNKSDDRKSRQNSFSQAPRRTKTGYASLAGSKARQPESTRNMTVETETVQSIPHSGLNPGERSAPGRGDNSGSVKLKSSNETIRPKKERRQHSKKPRSVNQGTASSKADIFEARVANAVDEANSSDSDETFVYESNPPEPRRPRHHSRTPSVTSAHSAVDARTNIRNFGEVMDERRVAGKRSMKFSNNPFNDRDSPTDRQDGSVRSHHPRHYGRFGRSVRDSSMSEQDSPFTQASKLRQNPASIRHSRPNSPRSPQTAQYRAVAPPVFGRKKDAGFELDAEGADDERTPLMGTIRAQRSARHGSRANAGGGGSSRASSIDEFYGVRSHGRCGKLGGCLLGVLVFAIVVLSTVAFLVVSNRPLTDVRIRRIDNVLASEQELMLDMLVAAVNPNALSVTVTNMDVNVFAKSRYVGNDPDHALHDGNHTDAILPRDRRRKRLRNALKPTSPNRSDRARRDGVDDGTDPPDDGDLDSDAQTMLLGRISHFDQALAFEGSPLKRHLHLSVGEVRLARPGNLTESGGSARWEHVLHHPFELIVRGVLRYRLPVSAREESAAVGASVVVMPEDGVDRRGAMRTRPVDRSERWQWIDWDEVEDKSENGSADDKDEVLS